MASIHITEEDFLLVGSSARTAKDDGDEKAASELDKLARKMNAALTNEKYVVVRRATGSNKSLTWEDVPSTLINM